MGKLIKQYSSGMRLHANRKYKVESLFCLFFIRIVEILNVPLAANI